MVRTHRQVDLLRSYLLRDVRGLVTVHRQEGTRALHILGLLFLWLVEPWAAPLRICRLSKGLGVNPKDRAVLLRRTCLAEQLVPLLALLFEPRGEGVKALLAHQFEKVLFMTLLLFFLKLQIN